MRKRKRPDWPQLVYKYRAYPREIPQAVWDTARRMQTLWNDLVALRNAVRTDVHGAEKAEAKARWARFNEEKLALMKTSGLNWECQADMIDRFDAMARKTAKEGATLRPHYGLDRVTLGHRYTNGGVTVEKFFAQRTAKRAMIEPIPSAVYDLPYRQRRANDLAEGHFGLDGATIEFVCHLHRPIPHGAIVKRVVWTGEFSRHRQHPWWWHIQLTVEIPPRVHDRTDTLVAGLDLGWRIMEEGAFVRLGYLADSAGREVELRLPLLGTDTKHIRSMLRHQTPASTLYDLWRLDQESGDSVDNCKERLKDRLVTAPAGFVQMRQAGLRKLRRAWQEAGEHEDEQALIAEWERYDAVRQHIRTSVQERLTRRKEWLYRNLAAWLTKTYRTICWKGDFSTKALAQKQDHPALQNAAKYRQWAALGKLRLYLQQAAVKNGCTIVGPNGAYSTLADYETGELATKGNGKLDITYPSGVVRDQDYNAAMNLLTYGLSQTSPEVLQEGRLRRFPHRDDVQALTIPEVLRAVAVARSRD
jgi:hypothetical protein